MAVTDWLVLPLRRVLPALGRLDTASLVAAWLIKLAQLTLLWSLLGAPGSALALLPASMLALAQLAVSALSALVLIYALMSWLQPGSDLYYTLGRLCEPWLAPVRRVLPLIGGVIWLVWGRPRPEPRRGRRGHPIAPDDDPRFMRQLDEQAWRQRMRRRRGEE